MDSGYGHDRKIYSIIHIVDSVDRILLEHIQELLDREINKVKFIYCNIYHNISYGYVRSSPQAREIDR